MRDVGVIVNVRREGQLLTNIDFESQLILSNNLEHDILINITPGNR
jgi:hypothetical protein